MVSGTHTTFYYILMMQMDVYLAAELRVMFDGAWYSTGEAIALAIEEYCLDAASFCDELGDGASAHAWRAQAANVIAIVRPNREEMCSLGSEVVQAHAPKSWSLAC
jgi:hypothetical protein